MLEKLIQRKKHINEIREYPDRKRVSDKELFRMMGNMVKEGINGN